LTIARSAMADYDDHREDDLAQAAFRCSSL
jgi:hypothetical protein